MMKRLLPVLALVVLMWAPAATAVQGTGGETQTELVRQRLQEIEKRLELTPEQLEKIRPALTEEIRKLRAVREKYEGDSQGLLVRLRMGRELRAIQSSTDEELRKILSKEQMEEVGKIREEGRERFLQREGRN